MEKQPTYKAIIFDLGKVIWDYSFDLCFWNWGKAAGLDRTVVRKRFSFDETYGRFSEGQISEREYHAHVCELIGYKLTWEEFGQGWNSIYLDVFPGINRTLETLKKNYRLVALTNTNITHARRWREKFDDTVAHFEKIFCSFEIGARKPEKRAYDLVLNYLHIAPSEALFLDDKVGNVIGAEDAGIKGIRSEERRV